MEWNYDMDSCPLDTKVCLLSSCDCPILPQMEYVGTITFNGRYRERGKCYAGNPEYFYRSAIVAWKQYDEDSIDNDLIKALRCIASQDENGDCNVDRHNFLRKENEPKMYCNTKVWGDETMQCPYYQDKYETCFEDGECGEWLNKIADILDRHEEIKHFFEMEIKQANERMESLHNPMFNGVEVGEDKQIELNKAHIRFCEQVLKMIGSD